MVGEGDKIILQTYSFDKAVTNRVDSDKMGGICILYL
jgi:hypothetical protein